MYGVKPTVNGSADEACAARRATRAAHRAESASTRPPPKGDGLRRTNSCDGTRCRRVQDRNANVDTPDNNASDASDSKQKVVTSENRKCKRGSTYSEGNCEDVKHRHEYRSNGETRH
jgi:hypothetical protein